MTTAQAIDKCLRSGNLGVADVDAIVAAPASRRHRAALATRLDVTLDRITLVDMASAHTAALPMTLARALIERSPGSAVVLAAAGAGITAGAAIYRVPDSPENPAAGQAFRSITDAQP